MSNTYTVRRPAQSRRLSLRGLGHHLLQWGAPGEREGGRPLLVMLHGWMDVAASFQFAVDALHAIEGDARTVVALDWRGFGHSDRARADSYWFPDYLADLDALLDVLAAESGADRIDLLGHSMGANVAMIYAGVRPERIRRLANLEGFGMPQMRPAQAPGRYAQWLDALRSAPALRSYASVEEVAERLRANNPRLREAKARWLAAHWSARGDDGRWHVLADPAHKRPNPVLYRADEAVACWQRIAAPVLWVEGDQSHPAGWWGTRYPREEFEARLANVARVERCVLAPAGHMLHHDQPEALAARLRDFLEA